MASRRVGHDWATSLWFFTFMHWRRKWKPTPVFLPGESQGRGEPGGLPSMGSHRVEHDRSDLAAAAATGFSVLAIVYRDSSSIRKSCSILLWPVMLKCWVNGVWLLPNAFTAHGNKLEMPTSLIYLWPPSFLIILSQSFWPYVSEILESSKLLPDLWSLHKSFSFPRKT